MTQPTPKKSNKAFPIIALLVFLGAAALFAVKLKNAADDKHTYSQLPPEVRRDLDQAAGNVTVPEPPAYDSASNYDTSDFSTDLASYLDLSEGMDSADAETRLRNWLTAAAEGEGNSSTDFKTIYETDGRTVLVATREGLMDDSIAGEQVYAEFTPVSPLTNSLGFYGLRIKCARGSNTTQWQTQPCP